MMARGREALAEAASLVTEELAGGAFVEQVACDASCENDVRAAVDDFVARRGVPDYMVNLVGSAYPHYFEELTLDDYRRAMEHNYFGQLVPALAIAPHFLQAGRGHLAFTSSALGFVGIMGYATYAPTKYAVVGLAEVLRSELGPRGLDISVLFPPDTDTPGFEIENRTKPAEWFATSAVKLMSPDAVADVFVRGLLRRRFYILPGQSAWLWRLARWAPGMLHWYADRELAAARRKLGKADA